MAQTGAFDLRCTQMSLRDFICMISLLGIVIGGVVDRMHKLPKVTSSYVTREAVTSPMPGIADVTKQVILGWHTVLAGGIAAGSAMVIATLFTIRLLFHEAGSETCQPLSRIAGAAVTMLFLFAFWAMAEVTMFGNCRQVFSNELKTNLGEAIQSRGVVVASAVATFAAILEVVCCHRWTEK